MLGLGYPAGDGPAGASGAAALGGNRDRADCAAARPHTDMPATSRACGQPQERNRGCATARAAPKVPLVLTADGQARDGGRLRSLSHLHDGGDSGRSLQRRGALRRHHDAPESV